jgi:hypothetical protein
MAQDTDISKTDKWKLKCQYLFKQVSVYTVSEYYISFHF